MLLSIQQESQLIPLIIILYNDVKIIESDVMQINKNISDLTLCMFSFDWTVISVKRLIEKYGCTKSRLSETE